MKKVKVLTIILAITFMVVGCNSNKETITSEKESQSAVNSDYIHLTMVKPTTINPILNKDKSVGYIMNLIYDGLFTIDENYNVVPQLVEEYGMSQDGMRMNIKLKDAKWHDGSEVTSQDVKFTVNLIQKNSDSPYNIFTENISSVSIINNKELNINFKAKNAFSIDTLIFPIVSNKHLDLSNNSQIAEHKKNLIGNGPYKIEKFEERDGIILVKNEKYYEELPTTMKNIEVSVVPDEEAQVSMVMALESDIASINLQDLSKFHEKEFNTTSYEGRDYEYLLFNYDNPYLKDVNLRKAIAHSINKKLILEEGYMGDATLVNFPLNSKSKYYDNELKDLEYSKEKAKEYLEKLNITNSEDLETDKDKNKQNNTEESKGTDTTTDINTTTNSNDNKLTTEEIKKLISRLNLRIIVNKGNSERVKSAHIVSENLKAIGIKSTVDELSLEDIDNALNNKEYDLALLGWELSNVPDVRTIIESSGYTDEKLINYMTSLVNATTQNQIEDIYKSIQKHIRDNVAFISLVIRDDYIVTNRRLDGKISPNDFDVYEGISNLNIKVK